MRTFFDNAANGILHTAHHHKSIRIDAVYFGIQFIQLQSCDDGEDDLGIVRRSAAAQVTAFALVDGNPFLHFVDYHFPDFIGPGRDDGDAYVFFDAFNHEIERFGSREVGNHGIQGDFRLQEVGRCGEDEDIEDDNDVADGGTELLAQIDGQHFGAVDYRAAPHGHADATAEEESAEKCDEQIVVGDFREIHHADHQREKTYGYRCLDGEAFADEFKTQQDERNIDHKHQEVERCAGQDRNEQCDTGSAAVDEMVGQKKSFEPEC